MIRSLWDALWPNVFSPNAWTLLALAGHLAVTLAQRERQHRDLKAHITATAGGIPVDRQQRSEVCLACGASVPATQDGKLAAHSSNGVTCVASGWTIKEK